MSQAITGVTPATQSEATIMTTYPSMGATPFGQWLGRAYQIKAGFGNILTVGHLIALLAIPQALALYFLNLFPFTCRRYRLTNRRVVVERSLRANVVNEISLDNFDDVQLQVLPGQEWYPCGDLVFLNGKVEALRLAGVPHPESFRRTCLKARRGYAGVKKATRGK